MHKLGYTGLGVAISILAALILKLVDLTQENSDLKGEAESARFYRSLWKEDSEHLRRIRVRTSGKKYRKLTRPTKSA